MAASVTFLPTAARRRTGWRPILARVQGALAARVARRQLAEMDDRRPPDIGASRAEATWEASRPLWELRLRR